jgi:adhesin transport system membrane fusion protein
MRQPNPSLFREEALKHYLQTEEGRGLVKVSPPWTWTLLLILLVAIGTAVVVSFLGHVEVNGRGRGIIRPSNGVRILVSQSGGTVESIFVRSGQLVKGGEVILRVAAPNIQAQLLEAERQAESVGSEYQTLSLRQDVAYAEQFQRMKGRIAALQEQLVSYRESIPLYERRLKAKLVLEKDGLVSAIEVDDARENLSQAKRQVSAAQQSMGQAKQEGAALESRRQDEIWQRKQVVQNAETKRDTMAFVRGQTVVVAPENGVVEALLVNPGEVLQLGQAVGKLIPQGVPLQVVSFLAEKDRAFVKVGDEVHLELEQLPYSEYGTVRARVARVSDDLASPYEIREALGEDLKLDAPTYRVELEITDTKALTSANVKLRTGMLMNVRYTLRRQRFITLVLDPLRRWFR